MRVTVGHPTGWEVDPVAAQEPARPLVELDRGREQGAVAGRVAELPDERAAANGRRAEVGGAALDVVDGPVSTGSLHAVGMLEERQDQWKYWPPSITIVCPVTNPA